MYKLVLFVMMIVFYVTITALQMDEELAMHTLFQAKHSLNRSVHAAAQQVDYAKLSRGVYAIDPERAETMALVYLRENMNLDSSNEPLTGSFLKAKVEVTVFEVFNEDQVYPYTYSNPQYDYSIVLMKPGVVMIMKVEYPRLYHVIGPITWQIKGAAELIY